MRQKHQQFLSECWPLLLVLMIPMLLSPIMTENIDIWIHYGRLIMEQGTLHPLDQQTVASKLIFFPTPLSSLMYYFLHRTIGHRGIGLLHLINLYLLLYTAFQGRFRPTYVSTLILLLGLSIIYPYMIYGPGAVALTFFCLAMNQASLPGRLHHVKLFLLLCLWMVWHPSYLIFAVYFPFAVLAHRKSGQGLGLSRDILILMAALSVLFVASVAYFDLLNHALQTSLYSRARQIHQWLPLGQWANIWPTVMHILLGIVLFLTQWRALSKRQLTLLLILFLFAFTSYRMTPWFMLPALRELMLRPNIPLPDRSIPPLRGMMATIAAGVMAIVAAIALVFWQTDHVLTAQHRELLGDAKARIFNQWEFGGELLVERRGKVAMDNRNTIYDPLEFEQYSNVLAGTSESLAYLQAMKFEFVMVTPDQERLIQLLKAHHYQVFTTKDYVLLRAPAPL